MRLEPAGLRLQEQHLSVCKLLISAVSPTACFRLQTHWFWPCFCSSLISPSPLPFFLSSLFLLPLHVCCRRCIRDYGVPLRARFMQVFVPNDLRTYQYSWWMILSFLPLEGSKFCLSFLWDDACWTDHDDCNDAPKQQENSNAIKSKK